MFVCIVFVSFCHQSRRDVIFEYVAFFPLLTNQTRLWQKCLAWIMPCIQFMAQILQNFWVHHKVHLSYFHTLIYTSVRYSTVQWYGVSQSKGCKVTEVMRNCNSIFFHIKLYIFRKLCLPFTDGGFFFISSQNEEFWYYFHIYLHYQERNDSVLPDAPCFPHYFRSKPILLEKKAVLISFFGVHFIATLPVNLSI